jgi:hypothetical protein
LNFTPETAIFAPEALVEDPDLIVQFMRPRSNVEEK